MFWISSSTRQPLRSSVRALSWQPRYSLTYRCRVAGLTVALGLLALAASAASAAESVPIVRCSTVPSTPGFLPQFKPSGLPRGLTAELATTLTGRLAFYSTGWVTVLAPVGWKCSGGVGATGALWISVVPPHTPRGGASVSDFLAGRDSAAVTAYFGSPGTGEVGGLACPFFAAATPQPGWARCPAIPQHEQTARLGVHAVAFEDPPHVEGTGDPSGGPYPANGVVIYNATSRPATMAAEETCTLQTAEHGTCTAILNDFVRRYPLDQYPA
jgi:hypothetical protein